MKRFGYHQSNLDHPSFIKRHNHHVILLIIYVDDMVVIENCTKKTQILQDHLAFEFKMKDLGSLKYLLGIEVSA